MIEYLNLKQITALHLREIETAVEKVIESGWYLQGKSVSTFERQYATYIGTRWCVSCGNGLDALTLIFRACKELGKLKEGDEVIVPANTYIASILSITENRLKPILVEPRWDTMEINDQLLEGVITPRTKALLLVHLYGRCAMTPNIAEICQRHGLLLIEDNAQAHGCQYIPGNGDRPCHTGSLGYAAAHSFYPGKNLGALGDAGAVTTDDETLAQMVRALGNYGSSHKYVFPYQGRNSRMDELQAAVLSVKLPYLDQENNRRKEIAKYDLTHIHNDNVVLPLMDKTDNVWHVFPIRCKYRDQLQAYLDRKGIGTMIHYPIPPHQQACYREWKDLKLPITEKIHREELSLPLHQALTNSEVETIIKTVNSFHPFDT